MKAAIAALFAATLLVGCVGNNTQSLVIEQNNVPQMSSGTCVAPGSASTEFRPSGILDLSLLAGAGTEQQEAGYLMFPVVINNLSSSVGGSTVTIADTAFNIQLKRTDVEVSDADGGRLLTDRFSVPVFKVLGAGDSAGLIVDVLPWAAVQNLGNATMVIAKLTIVGERDGSDIRSNTVEYAIRVCDGCLQTSVGPCADFSGTGTYNTCNIAQDDPVACCDDASGTPVCPAVGTSTGG